MALPYGINIIEKHVTINRAAKGVDYYSSLEMSDFKEFVNILRESKKAIGCAENYSEDELITENQKKWLCNKNLKKEIFLAKIYDEKTPEIKSYS